MQRLAGVLLEVGAGQVDRLLDQLLAFTELDGELAADDDGQFELADLVTLGQVGVEVILAREYGLRGDLTLDSKAEADRAFDGALVQHRQHAGQGDIDSVGLDIGFGAERRRAAGKDLRARLELNVRLDADDDFPLIHRVLLTMHSLLYGS